MGKKNGFVGPTKSNDMILEQHVVIKVHVILWSSVVLTWMRDIIELVLHVTLWNKTKEDLRTI